MPPESMATRREVYGAIVSFVVGFLGAAVTCGWLILRFMGPETRWWEIPHTIIVAMGVSLIAGLALAGALVTVLSRWHFRRGMYRCPYCDRPRKGIDSGCECPDVQALKAGPK
jgi:hypothetical protein